MTQQENISIVENTDVCSGRQDAEVIRISMEAAGKDISLNVAIHNEEATLGDIVPIARVLSSRTAIAARQDASEKGQTVPCCKGCDSCCSSLIPMSVPEVFRMNEEFMAMPREMSNALLRKCIKAATRILEKTHQSDYLKNFARISKSGIGQINKWYGTLGLECPFLENSLCSIYDQRPMACREHIVLGSPQPCRRESLCRPKVVPMKVSILEALGQLASELEQTEVEAIILPFSVAWAQDNLERAARKWPTVEMVRRFEEILHDKTGKRESVLAASN